MSEGSVGAISAAVLSRVVDYVGAKGGDAEALCRSVGVSPNTLRTPGARVPYELAEALGVRAQKLLDDPRFGLHLGQFTNESSETFDDAGVLAIMASATVAEAIERLERFQRLWGDGNRARIAILDNGGARYTWTSPVSSPESRRHADECAMAEVVVGLRAVVSPSLAPERVRFAHSALDDVSEHEAFFRCPIAWSAEETSLELSPEVMASPMPHANAAFCRIFERQIERALARLPIAPALVDSVRAVARATLGTGHCTLEHTARALKTSPRTLQRRLHDEGTSWAQLVDALRHEIALECVARGRSSIEIAEVLGYTDATAFHHAFKRWTGQTPEQARARKP
ncbi:MAG: AraC family transcriptional regulator [Myxococcales bacterium]|nr:AraC family transcriptional regulator [Myxococcales bacterium]